MNHENASIAYLSRQHIATQRIKTTQKTTKKREAKRQICSKTMYWAVNVHRRIFLPLSRRWSPFYFNNWRLNRFLLKAWCNFYSFPIRRNCVSQRNVNARLRLSQNTYFYIFQRRQDFSIYSTLIKLC